MKKLLTGNEAIAQGALARIIRQNVKSVFTGVNIRALHRGQELV